MPEPELDHLQIPKPLSPLKRNLIIAALGVAALSVVLIIFALTKPPTQIPTPTPQASSSAQVATTPAAPVTPQVITPEPTATWTPYTNTTGHYSLSYNPAWKTKSCPDSPASFFLAPTAASLGACQSDFGGQMQVLSMTGDQRASLKYGSDYDKVTTTTVTVGGTSSERQTATAKAPAALGPPAGTKLVQYLIFAGGRTYLASYQQQPSGDVSMDVLSDFDLMVKNTLKFI